MSQGFLFHVINNPRTSVLCALIVGASTMTFAQVATVPAGVPLRVEIDHRYPIKTGTHLEAHLIPPIYLFDHHLLPFNTRISGTFITTHPFTTDIRTNALLNLHFTPLSTPHPQS